VLADVGPYPRHGELLVLVACRLAKGGHGFERELGVDHQQGAAGQVDAAVGPRPVGERGLEVVAVLRQPVLDDGLHLALAEGAARLLVAEHLLQGRDLRGEVGNVLLRAVDDGEARVQLLQMLGGMLGGRLHRLTEVLRHRVEPGVHGVLKLGVGVLQPASHGVEPGVELGQPLLGRQVGLRRFRPQQQHDNGDDAGRDDRREHEEERFRHGRASSAIRGPERTKSER